jgi:arginine deiminase
VTVSTLVCQTDKVHLSSVVISCGVIRSSVRGLKFQITNRRRAAALNLHTKTNIYDHDSFVSINLFMKDHEPLTVYVQTPEDAMRQTP